MSSAPNPPSGTHPTHGSNGPHSRLDAFANFATRAARSSTQGAMNLGATRPGVAKMIAVVGAGVLLIGGGIFAYNSLHQEENAFLATGEEYARVCQNANTGERVDDSECEKAGVQEPTAAPSVSTDPSGSGSSGSGSSYSSTTTHHNSVSNAFLWYYLGRQIAQNSGTTNSVIPRVGEKLSGGSTTRPATGTVYSGVSTGGGFEDSYRTAKRSSTFSSGQETSSKSGGKTSTVRDKTTGTASNGRRGTGSGSTGYKGSNSSGSSGKSGSSSKSGSKGGFGGGSKSGGGTSGG